MRKLCILVSMAIVGAIGWWLGSKIGLMTSYALSVIGSVLGVYIGWRVHRDYLS